MSKALDIIQKRIKPLDANKMGEFEYEHQEFENKQMTIVKQALEKLDKIEEIVTPYTKGERFEFYQLPIDLADIIKSIVKE